MSKEITGESLNTFTINYLNTARYETEKQLGERYGLDGSQLYEFFQKSGRMFNGFLKEYLFRPKENLQFGPVVCANKTLYFYKNYWNSVFTDDKHSGVLKEILKTKESLTNCLNIAAKSTSHVVRPHWSIDYLQDHFKVSETGELLGKTPSGWKVMYNDTGEITYLYKVYKIKSLIYALNRGKDYVNVEGTITDEDLIPTTNKNNFNITNDEYDCFVLVAYKKDGSTLVESNFKTVKDRNALLGLVPTI